MVKTYRKARKSEPLPWATPIRRPSKKGGGKTCLNQTGGLGDESIQTGNDVCLRTKKRTEGKRRPPSVAGVTRRGGKKVIRRHFFENRGKID